MKNLVTVFVFFITFNLFAQNKFMENSIGKDFPEFELSTLGGEKINLKSLKGKVVFINLWFTACAPCIEEIPELNKLKEKYADKVEFYAITFDDADKVNKFLKKRDFKFNHIIGADSFVRNTLQNKSFPLNIIIDKEGIIQYVNGGIPFTKDKKTGKLKMLTYEFFENPLNKILK